MNIIITESQYLILFKLINENTIDSEVGDVTTMSDKERHDIFKKEIEPKYKFLYTLSSKYYNNPETRRELVQDTMVNAFKGLDNYTIGTNMEGWLSTIMKNNYLNNYRKRKRELEKNPLSLDSINQDYFQSDDYDEKISNDTVDTSYEDQDFTYGDDLHNALNKLPNDLKKMFIMSNVEYYPNKEIAQEFNIPIGTVKSRLFKIKQFLTKELNPNAPKVTKTKIQNPNVKKYEKVDNHIFFNGEFYAVKYMINLEKHTKLFKDFNDAIKFRDEILNLKNKIAQDRKPNLEKLRASIPPEYVGKINLLDNGSYKVAMMINKKVYVKFFRNIEDAINYYNEIKLKKSENILKNTEGLKHINKYKHGYLVRMLIKGQNYGKSFNNLEDAIDYRNELLIKKSDS